MKGYVVRGKDEQGSDVFAENWLKGAPFKTPTQAAAYALNMRGDGCTDLRILRVEDDGTETPLPSYEDALGQRDALLTLLDRVDYDGKSLPGALRDDIGKVLDAARKAGWVRP